MKEFLAALFITVSFESSAQGVFSNEINSGLQAVLQDYPNALKNVKGDLVAKKGQTSEFNSRVQIPGTVGSGITESRGNVSWKVTLYKNADFDKASEKLSDFFNQINKAIIKSGNDKPFILTGNYTEPAPSRPTSIPFELLPSTGEFRDVLVELNMRRSGRDYVIEMVVRER